MTAEEKWANPSAKNTGGYFKHIDRTEERQRRWNNFSPEQRETIMQTPNFDKEIFKEITGIDVDVK